jgi:hypothetical protein
MSKFGMSPTAHASRNDVLLPADLHSRNDVLLSLT